MRIAIIGAGPAGMTAAIEAARTKAEVLLLDANPNPGRKLGVTGSGRCNLSNTHANPDKYHTSDPEPLIKILNQFGNRELITWLERMGIYTTTTEDGWVYPASFSAQNVVDIFQAQLKANGVAIHPHTLITEIHPEGNQFNLSTQDKKNFFTADKVVIATGGPAAPQLGARQDIYPVLKQLGHTILPVKPALAPILTDPRQFHKLQGVRLDAGITLLVDARKIVQTIGNIIFTSWGINGPGVMDLSHLVHQYDPQNLELSIDFMPHQPERLEKMIQKKENGQLALSVLLKSFFPAKLAEYFLDQCRIPLEKTSGQITDLDRIRLLKAIHQQGVKIMGVKGFKDCQLSTGGVPLKEIDAETMHSTIVSGLSLAGEVLDVIGPCGGYNLQWAFSSGYIAGKRILQ
jgi:predicted Rossmann fold flavoprotein